MISSHLQTLRVVFSHIDHPPPLHVHIDLFHASSQDPRDSLRPSAM
jgi:hypothetical protein